MARVQRWRWTVTGVAGVLLLAAVMTATSLRAQERIGFFLFAADGKGAPVVDLTMAEVSVKEDAGDARTLTVDHFGWPLKLTILLDNGPGTRDIIFHYRDGLQKLFDGLPSGLPVSLIATAPQPRWLLREVTDRQQIKKGIGLITVDEGFGMFADSLIEYAKRLDTEFRDIAPENMPPYLPVLIVMSTTDHDGSQVTREQNIKMIQSLRRHRVWTNFVMIRPGKAATANMDRDFVFDSGQGQSAELGKIVQENTGGQYFPVGGSGASGIASTILPDLARNIALRHVRQTNQYRVVFERPASATGPPNGLSVSLRRPGLQLTLSPDGSMP